MGPHPKNWKAPPLHTFLPVKMGVGTYLSVEKGGADFSTRKVPELPLGGGGDKLCPLPYNPERWGFEPGAGMMHYDCCRLVCCISQASISHERSRVLYEKHCFLWRFLCYIERNQYYVEWNLSVYKLFISRTLYLVTFKLRNLLLLLLLFIVCCDGWLIFSDVKTINRDKNVLLAAGSRINILAESGGGG